MDIDIDVADRNLVLSKIKYRIARMKNNKNHTSGIYVTEIPHDPITNRATIDYQEAAARGYFKIDLLNVSIYKDIHSEEHLIKLINTEPLWDLLEEKKFVDQLFHISGHHSILKQMKPRSLEQLAAILAIIRPAKKHLIGKDWNTVLNEVWIKPNNNDYYFKKSHGFAYAQLVMVHMNLLCELIESNNLTI